MERKTAKNFSRAEILRIAMAYGDPRNDVDYRSFLDVYNISESTFRRLLEIAVERSIVSDKVIEEMKSKAKFNVDKTHEGKGKELIEEHYRKLKRKQEEYLAEHSIKILQKFAESTADKRAFCKEEVLSEDGMNWILRNFLTSAAIPDDVFWNIQWKFVRRFVPKNNKNFWIQKNEERKSNKNKGE